MKPIYTLLIVIVLLTSCSKGYYSHIPRTKTTVTHHIITPVKEVKDTVLYKLLPPVIIDTIQKVKPKVFEAVKLFSPTEDTLSQANDTTQQVVSYDTFVHSTFLQGLKKILINLPLTYLANLSLVSSEPIIGVIMSYIFSSLTFAGIVFIIGAGVLWLTRRKTSHKLAASDKRGIYEKTLMWLTLILFLTFLAIGLIGFSDIITMSNYKQDVFTAIFTCFGAVISGIMLLLLYIKHYRNKHAIKTYEGKKDNTRIKPGIALNALWLLLYSVALAVLFAVGVNYITGNSIFVFSGYILSYLISLFSLMMFAVAIFKRIFEEKKHA